MSDDVSRIRYSGFRVVFYLFSLLWMITLLGFEENASHFGWGFFPLLASIVVVPVILVALFADVIMRIVDACTLRSYTLVSRIVALVIPAVLLIGSGIWLYKEMSA